MNCLEAINAHVSWKVKLKKFIDGEEMVPAFNTENIGDYRRCELGEWLYGEGAIYANDPNYEAVLAEHEKFHQCAAKLVDAVGAGSDKEEIAQCDKQLSRLSHKISVSLAHLGVSLGR